MNPYNQSKFEIFIKEKVQIYPLKESIFDVFVDILNNKFVQWESKVEEPNSLSYISTPSTIKFEFLTKLLLNNGANMLLNGDSACGKSAIVKNHFNQMNKTDFSHATINMSGTISPDLLKKFFADHSMKISKDTVLPKERKSLICFLDDLNQSFRDPKNNQPALEFVRHFIDYGFYFEDDKPKYMNKVQFACGMRRRIGVDKSKNFQRLVNKFHVLNLNPLEENEISKIFSGIVKVYSKNFSEEAVQVLQRIGSTTANLISNIGHKFKPIPTALHYCFDLKEGSRIIEGICLGKPDNHTNKQQILKLWIHECFRVIYDRLNSNDHLTFYEEMNESLSANYEVALHNLCPNNESPFYSKLLGDAKVYEDLLSYDDIKTYLYKIAQANIKNSGKENKVILFKEAVQNILKIIRVGLVESGHMLIMASGSGKNTALKVAGE